MKKRRTLEEILGSKINAEYSEQHAYIMELVGSGRIKPVLASKKNGKKPPLYREYWELEEEQDYSALKQELLFNLTPQINITYYQNNLEAYDKERKDVLSLSSFLQNSAALLTKQVSYNERSFQIWQREKFLLQGAGKKILKHCGLELAELNCYSTCEPFSYFALTRQTPQKILIIENKDTFFSMRKHLLAGNELLFGEKISSLIYGAGKRVISCFQEFAISAEPYMLDAENELLYFGDFDYEGIGIYEKLAEGFGEQGSIKPFIPAYLEMRQKSKGYPMLPTTKEEHNRNLQGSFFNYFSAEVQKKMQIDEQFLFDKAHIQKGLLQKLLEMDAAKDKLIRKLTELQKRYQALQTGKTLELSPELVQMLEHLGINIVYGFQWLKENSYDEVQNLELVKQHPFLPYALLMSAKEVTDVPYLLMKSSAALNLT